MTGKEIILNYCNNIKTGDIDYLQSCIDIINALENNDKTHLISHCPSAFGLEEFIGLCETYDENNEEQCSKCWDEALSICDFKQNKKENNYMRNKDRIKPFLQKVEELWLQYPDLRFGQIIYMIADKIGRDIFFPEEKEWELIIDKMIRKEK